MKKNITKLPALSVMSFKTSEPTKMIKGGFRTMDRTNCYSGCTCIERCQV
ncbi:hypothetical protein AB9P05_11530 [Roseivirga sp. BDSF3-8]